ncbi:hypothetical protein CTAYLR_010508 [Chrysophaeum taylorii]|uniref:Mannosyl-3-phosphoglycerate phosphatase n=1 Tax=Chrysophaeum taylorii TaxID=2483200 RepID=A0AAD7UHY4_9STRA|nr:hypothetical protein CTAYLR_010508 [Chrysophaeum taylorii]
MRPLQTEIDAATGIGVWPVIVENGAGVLWPHDGLNSTSEVYQQIRDTLQALPANVAGFHGFGDMTAQEVADRTGLPSAKADLAKQRQFSEPGVWDGTSEGLQDFLSALAEHGLHARQGGRFLTLSFGQTKADAMAELVKRYQPATTIALGDAPNDREMLEAADFGVIVRNPHAKPLPLLRGEDTGRIIRTQDSGPSGWADAILSLLAGLTDR